MKSPIVVGIFFGYLLDKLLGTRPWMLFLAAVGFLGLEHSLISGKNRRFFSFDLS
ncbi:MAG TPA: AtpZ/AtpI family protein [Acidobacteriota bacterium]